MWSSYYTVILFRGIDTDMVFADGYLCLMELILLCHHIRKTFPSVLTEDLCKLLLCKVMLLTLCGDILHILFALSLLLRLSYGDEVFRLFKVRIIMDFGFVEQDELALYFHERKLSRCMVAHLFR